MASRLPPLLEPYLHLPPETSLILLTGVLGSSTNWLAHRYLHSLLSPRSVANPEEHGSDQADTGNISVILVSFLRDYTFWKEGLGRLGVDLDASTRRGRFAYVDGLGALFQPSLAHRGKAPSGSIAGRRVLSAPTLNELRKGLEDAISFLKSKITTVNPKIVLVIDQLDLFLAATGENLSAQALHETLLDIRENVHSTIVTLSADEPLISSQTTLLEKEHAAFALSIAHSAHMVIGLRMLDTGTAKDVSGVLRITRGGQYDQETENAVDERELLYFVGGDGGVRVFERGQ
ncbi:hypothetical protein DL769_004053 [Monosporascus sp. CRB-8-3]|nr:hypothetical protein DL769_004053 [Monosporascus sp. CRB-8-3]